MFLYGVSPAFFISSYSSSFTYEDMLNGLETVSNMGFDCWQPEVFLHERLEEWNKRCSEIMLKAESLQLKSDHFVAHMLLHAFSSPEAVYSDYGIKEAEQIANSLSPFDSIRYAVIPVPAFEKTSPMEKAEFEGLYKRFSEKLADMKEIFENRGKKLSLEIMPKSIIGGSDGFLRLIEYSKRLKDLGIIFDSGHMNTSPDELNTYFGKCGAYITGTHLCDNNGRVNASLPPGKGNICWEDAAENLKKSGYSNSYDLEIICNPKDVSANYYHGLKQLQQYLQEGE